MRNPMWSIFDLAVCVCLASSISLACPSPTPPAGVLPPPVINSVSPSLVLPYAFSKTQVSFTMSFVGMHLDCLDGFDAPPLTSPGVIDITIPTFTDPQHAQTTVYLNSVDVCPPDCVVPGPQHGTQVDVDGQDGNTFNFTIDYPAYMIVVLDTSLSPDATHPNPGRQTLYEVHNSGGSIAPLITIGESINYTATSPPCAGTIAPKTASCSQMVPAKTSTLGRFTDIWRINSATSPAGCGWAVHDDWQVCPPDWASAHQGWTNLPKKSFATLTGYIHTNKVNILNHITPPQSGAMPTNFKIVPQ